MLCDRFARRGFVRVTGVAGGSGRVVLYSSRGLEHLMGHGMMRCVLLLSGSFFNPLFAYNVK